MSYDSWLEAPYVRASQDEAELERIVEEHDLDPNDEESWETARELLEESRHEHD